MLEQSDGDITLAALAKSVGFSPYYFHRLFKARLGITPRQYQQQHRLRRFKSRLRRSQTVGNAIYDAGFGSATRAYAGIGTKLGMSPRQYRNGGAGIEIAFCVKETDLGWCLIAATNHGVCAIDFGGTPKELRQRLSSEFSQATLSEDAGIVKEHFERLTDYLARPGRGLSLPLDLKGTAFQCQVWQALRNVPAGQTVTYTDLAKRVGKPQAIRAVASACAANRVALAVPCHRALRVDGELGGYRWGLERKRQLLRREKAPNEE
jgi:AraC family transcriptional regulator of adaptative response/methylated-DNA-[protein]-cysteine methyltransferase